MRILIVGARGFIGRRLCALLRSDHEIYTCDVVPGEPGEKGYFQVQPSVPDFDRLFADLALDFCVNCSGAASVPDSFTAPLRDFSLNTLNVFRLADSIRRLRPSCGLVNLSSAAVYGNPSCVPVGEDSTLLPISPYGNHKLMAERILEEHHRFFAMRTCSVRIFSAYGEGLRKQVLFDLSSKLQGNATVELFGTGLETRDFIHVDDICRAIVLVLQRSTFDGDVVNVANGKQVSIATLATLLSTAWGTTREIRFSGAKREGDPLYWEADISRLVSYGYFQTVEMSEGVARYVEWIKREFGAVQ